MDFAIAQSQGWKEGRRIVDLQEMARQMRCKHCKSLLDLNLTIKETRFGLASVLYIMCQCGVLNDVHTARKQENEGSRPIYEINIKASINMLLYGMGAQNIISFLQAVLDIPVPPPEDNSLIIPVHSSTDVLAAGSASLPSYNASINTSVPPQLQVPQHHHLQLSHHQQQQQHILSVPQRKEACRSVQTMQGKSIGNETDAVNGPRCVYCLPCPHHSKSDTNLETKSTKKLPEKVKLTKDERDDLKVNTKCTVCKIVFRTREHYRMHKILHPQVRKKQRVKCSDCSAEFPDRSKLREHAKIHSGDAKEKPYKCNLCEKCFHKKSQRSKHIKRCHMKENSHVCNICGKRTFTKSELREHVRIHTGERPYQCEVCERSFRRKDYLTVHMRQHTGLKPYSCEHCGESFVQRVSLCKHLQTKHSTCDVNSMDMAVSQTLAHHQPPLPHTVTQDSMTSVSILHNGLFYQ